MVSPMKTNGLTNSGQRRGGQMVGGRSLPRPLALCAAILITLTTCGGAGTSSATPAGSATPVATKPPTFDEAAEAKKLYDPAVAAEGTQRKIYGTLIGYEDLANAKYKGQILVDNSDYEGCAGLVAIRGQQRTDDLLQKIVSTAGVTNLTGHGNINDKVVAGEFPIALNNYLNQAERSKRAGAPTEWIAAEPVVVQLGKYATSKSAPHPNAAKLLSNFLISFDAQKYLTSIGRITTRIDVPNDPPNLVSGLKKYAAAPMQSDQQNVIAAKMKQLFK